MRMFPILNDPMIQEVPWDFVAPHREWIEREYRRTLESLAHTGGLSSLELAAALDNRVLSSVRHMTGDEARNALMTRLSKFYAGLQSAVQAAPPVDEGGRK